MTTTLILVDEERNRESYSQAVVRRIRDELTERHVNLSEAARRCGLPQTLLWRRLNNRTPLTLPEIDLICQAMDLDRAYVMAGVKTLPTSTDQVAEVLQLPRMDSNHQPPD